MGIKRTGLTRQIDIWDLKSLKRHIIWRKMQKTKISLFHYCKKKKPNICA